MLRHTEPFCFAKCVKIVRSGSRTPWNTAAAGLGTHFVRLLVSRHCEALICARRPSSIVSPVRSHKDLAELRSSGLPPTLTSLPRCAGNELHGLASCPLQIADEARSVAAAPSPRQTNPTNHDYKRNRLGELCKWALRPVLRGHNLDVPSRGGRPIP